MIHDHALAWRRDALEPQSQSGESRFHGGSIRTRRVVNSIFDVNIVGVRDAGAVDDEAAREAQTLGKLGECPAGKVGFDYRLVSRPADTRESLASHAAMSGGSVLRAMLGASARS